MTCPPFLTPLLLGATLVCCAQSPRDKSKPPQPKSPQEVKKVNEIKPKPSGSGLLNIKLNAAASETIVGASIPVRVTVQNPGDGLAIVDDRESQSPFVFELRDTTREAVLRFSAENFKQNIFREPPPPVEPRTSPLIPGEEVHRDEDVAEYALVPPPAGNYVLSASYLFNRARLVTDPVPLRIVAPKPLGLAVVSSGDGQRLGSILLHQDAAGVTVYQRESFSNNPAVGVLRPRKQVAGDASVAIATDAGRSNEYRWFAWLSGERLQIAQAWGRDQLFATEPAAIGLQQSRLVAHGWTFDNNVVVFLAVGRIGNRTHLKVAEVAKRKGPSLREIDLAAAMPVHIVAGVTSSGNEKRIRVVWTEAGAAGVTRIMTRSFTPDGPPDEARLLFERALPVAALAIPAIQHEGASMVNVLLSSGPNQRPAVIRISLETGKLEAGLELAALGDHKPVDWAIEAEAWPPRIVMCTRNEVLETTAGSGSWTMLAKSANPSFPRIEKTSAPWAVWADTEQGLRYLPLP